MTDPGDHPDRGRVPAVDQGEGGRPRGDAGAPRHAKIFLNPRALLPRIEALRAAGKTIVFGNGCFDILHVGHVRYLQAARALGDALLVAVNTDASARQARPDNLPINPDHERMEVLAALEAVDFVVPLEDRLPNALLELFRPEIQAKGTDYTLDRMPERPVVEGYGGRIVFVGDPKNHSSSALRAALEGRGLNPGGSAVAASAPPRPAPARTGQRK